jgi:hypothetical protein
MKLLSLNMKLLIVASGSGIGSVPTNFNPLGSGAILGQPANGPR